MPRTVITGFIGLALLSAGAVRAADTFLEVGVFPCLSTQVILTIYQPVRAHLEEQLRTPR